MADFGELEIGLYSNNANSYLVYLRYQPPGSGSGLQTATGTAVFPQEALLEKRANLEEYGRELAKNLFADQTVNSLFCDALKQANLNNQFLHVRLMIDQRLPELQVLLWETLRSPLDNYQSWLMTDPQVYFSRFLISSDWTTIRLHRKDMLRALIFIANPTNIGQVKIRSDTGATVRRELAPIDVDGELKRARAALQGIQVKEVVSDPQNPGAATLDALVGALESFQPLGVDILYLVAHGEFITFPKEKAGPYLWLEGPDGKADQVPALQFERRMKTSLSAEQRPRLVVLVSCQSSGSLDEQAGLDDRAAADNGALMPLGPALASAGIPAVLAMQGSVTMKSMETFMPRFFETLRQDGLVDQAMNAARAAIQGRPDDWMPVLFSRLSDGTIWRASGGGGAGLESFTKWAELVTFIKNARDANSRIPKTLCLPVIGPGLLEPLVGSRNQAALELARMHGFPFNERDREILPQVAQFISFANSPNYTQSVYYDVLRKQLQNRNPALFPGALKDLPDLLTMFSKAGEASRQQDPTKDMHALLAGLELPLYLTTTPDMVLSDALFEHKTAAGEAVQPVDVICNWRSGATTAPGSKPSVLAPWVFYLFGRLDDPLSMVLTQDDYYDYLINTSRTTELIPEAVSKAMVEYSLLFLGFPLDDWGLRLIFRYLNNSPGKMRLSLHSNIAVQIDPEDGRIQDTERARRIFEKLFGTSHIEIFWGPAQEFIPELVHQVNKG